MNLDETLNSLLSDYDVTSIMQDKLQRVVDNSDAIIGKYTHLLELQFDSVDSIHEQFAKILTDEKDYYLSDAQGRLYSMRQAYELCLNMVGNDIDLSDIIIPSIDNIEVTCDLQGLIDNVVSSRATLEVTNQAMRLLTNADTTAEALNSAVNNVIDVRSAQVGAYLNIITQIFADSEMSIREKASNIMSVFSNMNNVPDDNSDLHLNFINVDLSEFNGIAPLLFVAGAVEANVGTVVTGVYKLAKQALNLVGQGLTWIGSQISKGIKVVSQVVLPKDIYARNPLGENLIDIPYMQFEFTTDDLYSEAYRGLWCFLTNNGSALQYGDNVLLGDVVGDQMYRFPDGVYSVPFPGGKILFEKTGRSFKVMTFIGLVNEDLGKKYPVSIEENASGFWSISNDAVNDVREKLSSASMTDASPLTDREAVDAMIRSVHNLGLYSNLVSRLNGSIDFWRVANIHNVQSFYQACPGLDFYRPLHATAYSNPAYTNSFDDIIHLSDESITNLVIMNALSPALNNADFSSDSGKMVVQLIAAVVLGTAPYHTLTAMPNYKYGVHTDAQNAACFTAWIFGLVIIHRLILLAAGMIILTREVKSASRLSSSAVTVLSNQLSVMSPTDPKFAETKLKLRQSLKKNKRLTKLASKLGLIDTGKLADAVVDVVAKTENNAVTAIEDSAQLQTSLNKVYMSIVGENIEE